MLWMITDFSISKSFAQERNDIEKAMKSGAGKLSFRNNGRYSRSQVLDLATELSDKYPDKDIFIHNPDNEALRKFDKFHFSERFFDEAVKLKRQRKQRVIAISLHSQEAIKEAFSKGLDYAFFSPVYLPISKPEDNRKTVEPIKMKNLYLLGGINRMRGRSLIERGFTNLAGISLFYGDTAYKDISELSELIKEKCK